MSVISKRTPERCHSPDRRDDGQREFVSLFCAPFLWPRLADAVRLESHSEAVQKSQRSRRVPESARSARGSSENEDGKEST